MSARSIEIDGGTYVFTHHGAVVEYPVQPPEGEALAGGTAPDTLGSDGRLDAPHSPASRLDPHHGRP